MADECEFKSKQSNTHGKMSCWTYYVSKCSWAGGCVSTTFGEKQPEPCDLMLKKVIGLRSGIRTFKETDTWIGDQKEVCIRPSSLEINPNDYICLLDCLTNSNKASDELSCRKFCELNS